MVATAASPRAGDKLAELFWPFAITSVPLAFVGGMLTLPSGAYKKAVGVVLFVAAVRLFFPPKPGKATTPESISIPLALAAGAGLGFLSGLTGTGGGIFL